jgi:hypothetical protein
MRGQAHHWYRPALARENARSGRQYRRNGETAFQAAFQRALQVWASRHSSDDDSPIVLPVGTVTAGELVRVITALIAARGHGHAGGWQ